MNVKKMVRPMPAVLSRRRERGATLLEVLVAMVVMALGLLGILGVQMRTLADTQTSVRRAQAIRLIEDLSERVHLNPDALNPAVAANYVITGWDAVATAPAGCGAGCTPAALATEDQRRWLQSVRSQRGFDAQVFLASDEAAATGNRRQLGVMIAWRENERTQDPDYVDVFRNAAKSGTIECKADSICHLQFIPLTARCVPDTLSGGQVFCSDGIVPLL